MLLDTQSCADDCSTETYGGFYVVVSDELPTSSASGWDLFDEATSSGTLCEHVTVGTGRRTPDGPGVPVTYACPTSTTGRYVYVQTSAKVVRRRRDPRTGWDPRRGRRAAARASGAARSVEEARRGPWNPPGADICEAWRNDAMCDSDLHRLRELGRRRTGRFCMTTHTRRPSGGPPTGTTIRVAKGEPSDGRGALTSWGRLLTTTPWMAKAKGINRATVAIARWTRRHATTFHTGQSGQLVCPADRASQEDARLRLRRRSAVLLQYHLYYKEYDACQENSDQSACNSLDYCSFDDGSGQCWTISNNVWWNMANACGYTADDALAPPRRLAWKLQHLRRYDQREWIRG